MGSLKKSVLSSVEIEILFLIWWSQKVRTLQWINILPEWNMNQCQDLGIIEIENTDYQYDSMKLEELQKVR